MREDGASNGGAVAVSGRADLTTRVFRASTVYEVVPYDRLSSRDRAALAELPRDPDFFGVLRPRDGATGTIKAISRNVALLIYALQTPGPIPCVAVASNDESILDAAWRLTLDGVLEIEQGDTFVSGPHALDGNAHQESVGTIANLSLEALRFASLLDLSDPIALADRLYHYNCRPITPQWVARTRTAGEVLRYCGANAQSDTAALLDRFWKAKTPARRDPWIMWWPRARGWRAQRTASEAHFKLYVSPQTEALTRVFPEIVRVLADAGAPPFKLGGTTAGLLRPDKLLIYSTRRDWAIDVSNALVAAIGDVSVHGVPFTSETGGNGLTSLGIDPPKSNAMRDRSGSSWRTWVCRRLASYLLLGRSSGEHNVVRFARERLSLDGVDLATWEPTGSALRGFTAARA